MRRRQSWHPLDHLWVNVSTTCVGEYVGLEEVGDRIWNVYFGALRIGRLLERTMKIEGACGGGAKSPNHVGS